MMGGSMFGAGLAGFLGVLLQVIMVGGLIWLAVHLFRRFTNKPDPSEHKSAYSK